MPRAQQRIVQRAPKGWEVKVPGAARASSVHRTQAEAEARAKQILKNLGGGEAVIKGVDGKIRDSDTVPHGGDPNPPLDTRH